MNKTCILTTLLLSFLMTGFVHAYPPDNAAVLYYKQSEFFSRPDDSIWEPIRDLPTSNDPAPEKVKAYFKKSNIAYLIQELQVASEIEQCDWGLDFSRGFEMLMPSLHQMKNFNYLLLANSAIQASEGNISEALEMNLVNRRMGHHISNDTLIGFLVSFAINRKSDEALTHLLSTYPVDEKTLVDFKNELLWENYQPKSIKHPLMMEKGVCLLEISIMTPERYKRETGDWGSTDEDKDRNKRALEYLKDIDPASRERAAAIFSKYYDDIFTIMEKPYEQAYKEIDSSTESVCKKSEEDKDAILPAIFCPALAKCYNHGIHWKTHYNATLTALDIYIATARTGQLPSESPKSSYIDHFSGKPFIYKVTDEGFTLKCQQEDLVKKTTHEFNYKLPK